MSVPPRIYRHATGLFTRGDTRALTPARRAALIGRHGIAVVVAIGPPPDPGWDGAGNVRYMHRRLADSKTIPDWVDPLAAGLAGEIHAGNPVLIYCAAGRNRSVLLAGLTYRWLTGCTGAAALARVRAVRPGCLANEHFAKYLRDRGAP